MKTLYVSDLDGTLITSRECISDYSIKILNDLLDKGIHFTYATARSIQTAKNATKGLHTDFPVIVYNGALIVNPKSNQIYYSATFEQSLKDYIVFILTTLDIYPLAYSLQEGKEKLSWLKGKETPSMMRYFSRRVNDERLCPVQETNDLAKGDVLYFNCMGDPNKMFAAYRIFSRDSRLNCFIHQETYQTDYWLEIFCKKATKEVAVKKLKEIYGFEKVVCFGDSINDIPMFNIADEKYAVKNADDALKKLSTDTIGFCEEDGVAKWLAEHYTV